MVILVDCRESYSPECNHKPHIEGVLKLLEVCNRLPGCVASND